MPRNQAVQVIDGSNGGYCEPQNAKALFDYMPIWHFRVKVDIAVVTKHHAWYLKRRQGIP